MKNFSTFAPLASRLLLGLIFAVFGLNGFFQFIPIPPAEGDAATFMGGLYATGYFFPMLATVQILVGAALLFNILTPIALIVLAPITVNIVAYHAIAPEGLPLAILVLALHLGVAWSLKARFLPLFQTPTAA
jgi:putative oxidoreductase